MKIFPAIDIKDSKVVRLTQGDYGKVSVYGDNPVDFALSFQKAGAKCIHLVDLDGAKDGSLSNYSTIKKIIEATDMFVEVGGGIRDESRIKAYLSIGVSRVILGTAAVNNFSLLEKMVGKYKDKIAVGVDAKDGYVAVDGWLTVTKLLGSEFCKKVRDIGVKTVIYTDIAKDGALNGINIELYRELNTIEGLDIVASGGITSLDDIKALRQTGISAAIVGKAIYAGVLDLSSVLKIAREME